MVPARLFGVGVQFAQVDPKLAQVESEFGSNLPNHPMAQVDAKLAQVDPKLAQVESEFGSNLPKFIHPMAQVDAKLAQVDPTLAQICPSSPQPAAAATK